MIPLIQAFASVGTFLIFVLTASFALRQLRSSNRSNQLAGLQAVSSHYNGQDFAGWFKFVMEDLPGKMEDPTFRNELRLNPIDRDVHLEIRLADWYEEVGILAKYGVVAEKPLIEFLRGGPETAWGALEGTIALFREIWGSSYYRNFERLAERSRVFYSRLDPQRVSKATSNTLRGRGADRMSSGA
jgi:hypothetical protein